jgi:hypothetical protein
MKCPKFIDSGERCGGELEALFRPFGIYPNYRCTSCQRFSSIYQLMANLIIDVQPMPEGVPLIFYNDWKEGE